MEITVAHHWGLFSPGRPLPRRPSLRALNRTASPLFSPSLLLKLTDSSSITRPSSPGRVAAAASSPLIIICAKHMNNGQVPSLYLSLSLSVFRFRVLYLFRISFEPIVSLCFCVFSPAMLLKTLRIGEDDDDDGGGGGDGGDDNSHGRTRRLEVDFP